MIPAKNKFPLRTDFLSFRKTAKTLRTSALTVYYNRNNSGPSLAVIISKKNAPLATKRNALKRTILDTAWSLLESEKITAIYMVTSKNPSTAQIKDHTLELTHKILSS